ncbi:uroporphyrinogen-III synthase [Sphingomonas sp. ac-8]|uniref:uroporphyrinogen-III synthase n=1 Tax=Sphingomonas sp. ac-8 TaxID=3242977 RepID=UPI003A7FC4CD
MSRALAVLRPEPGASATIARIETAGHRALRLPLFHVERRPWPEIDPADHDALVLTSANALRCAGAKLSTLLALPVWAVGKATARAATAAGCRVVAIGDAGAEALLDRAAQAGVGRALWLGGEALRLDHHRAVRRIVRVYASVPAPLQPQAVQALAGSVALVHSPRAAATLRAALDAHRIPPAALRLAAISPAAAAAAGDGWDRIAVAPSPSDTALVATAIGLAD